MPAANIEKVLRMNNMMDSFPLSLNVTSIILSNGTVYTKTMTANSVQEIADIVVVQSTRGMTMMMGIKIVSNSNGIILFPPGISSGGPRFRVHLPDALTGYRQ